jgi:hypothetical protein
MPFACPPTKASWVMRGSELDRSERIKRSQNLLFSTRVILARKQAPCPDPNNREWDRQAFRSHI